MRPKEKEDEVVEVLEIDRENEEDNGEKCTYHKLVTSMDVSALQSPGEVISVHLM